MPILANLVILSTPSFPIAITDFHICFCVEALQSTRLQHL